jgi:signal peptidase I
MKRSWLLVGLLAIIWHPFTFTDSALAVACQSNDTSYDATAIIDKGTYTVYARFGKSSQQSTATLIGSIASGECILNGTASVNGTVWSPIATLNATGSEITFELQSPLLAHLPDANRPLIMLVSQNDPACSVNAECQTTVGDQPATIQSPDIAVGHSALRVLAPKPLASLRVEKVSYYADNALMYTTSTLEEFDARMIAYYATHANRVITYSNGQQATLSTTLPYAHSDGPLQFVYRLWRQHSGVIMVLGIFLAVLVIQQIVKLVIYAIYRERRWRYAHGFLKSHLAALTNERDRKIATAKYMLQKGFVIVERVLFYGLIVAGTVFCLLTFVLQLTRIDGESMSPTLADGQLVTVNLIPVSVAHINQSYYVPTRGDMVAIHPHFGTSVTSDDAEGLIVKRIVGLPGERVTVSGSVVTIYNTTHPGGFNPDTTDTPPHTVINDETAQIDIDITLDKDEVFICGDNRPVSIDSRDNGAIGVSQIVGLVQGLPFGIK